VRDEQRRQREGVEQLAELGTNACARMRVQRGQRLVEQQHRGIPREGAGERDPLALAAGELGHTRAREVSDAEALEQVVHPRAIVGAEAHVPEHVEVRKQGVLLEQVADPPALGRDVEVLFGVEQDGPVDSDAPRLGAQEACDDAQGGGLPGARRTDEGERLARRDRQVG
jgi:hypothetical protein